MRGLVAKIFLASVLVQVITRMTWVTLMPLLPEAHPIDGRFVQQIMPYYAELAASTLEEGGPASLERLTQRIEAEHRLKLNLQEDQADCVSTPGTAVAPVIHGDKRYCLVAQRTPGPRRWHAPDGLVVFELALCGFFSYLLARYLLEPIRKISGAAQALARGDLTARVGPKLGRRRDEAGELVRQFDRMADRIALLIQAQQRFIGDVSHEIKSPLARISMALGLARREAGPQAAPRFDRIEREIDTISQLISELLTLSSLQAAGATRTFAPLNLKALVQAVLDDAAFERPDRQVRCTMPASDIVVRGDAVLLRRAIENVLRNALFYTPPGTAVHVTVNQTAGGEVGVTIRDQGPGVPNEALSHLFDPFYRVDEARARNTGGIGIGLAICDRAIRLHGGTVSAENCKPSGLAIHMALPATLYRGEPQAAAPAPALAEPATV